MRILVASDRIGSLSSAQAGRAIASGWPTEETRVVPVGDSGAGFVEAWSDACNGALESGIGRDGLTTLARAAAGTAVAVEPARLTGEALPDEASSLDWGRVLGAVLAGRPRRVFVDLSGPHVHDAGAGALAALGATADVSLVGGAGPLGKLTELDPRPARALLEGVELVGIVPDIELGRPLLGLRGITSLRGRDQGIDPQRLLAVDAALGRFAEALAPEAAQAPGAGACGGLGFLVLALGGRLATGPSVLLDGSGSPRPDLVLTGCEAFDFARRGGGVVAAAARLATQTLAPCVVLAGQVFVGSREMRTMGIEAAYAPHVGSSPASPMDADALAALARRVARTWHW
ncbi:MAG TPA: glycerate kinase [Microlunatus sp.]|nr:glycerate kinase [Microlunatus sp.]